MEVRIKPAGKVERRVNCEILEVVSFGQCTVANKMMTLHKRVLESVKACFAVSADPGNSIHA